MTDTEQHPHLPPRRTLVLASASPRRQELLERVGLTFTVDPSDYEEKLDPSLNPEDLAASISLGKARSAAARHPDAVIIAADTFGVLRGRLLGKPHTPGEARKMLRAISGKSHLVITGLTVLDSAGGKTVTRTVTTRVHIRRLSPQEIDRYVETGEPLDKAGAYAIQGLGAVIVKKIVGDYYNVVGLPLFALAESLQEMGIPVL